MQVAVGCKVMEENEVMIGMMPMKDKLKEKIPWDTKNEKKLIDWKTLNIKFLNLKDSKNKKEMKGSEFEKFCTLKGLTREKSTWEVEYIKEIEFKEIELKEMITKKKLTKSKKTKN
jgi:hypothetical protein